MRRVACVILGAMMLNCAPSRRPQISKYEGGLHAEFVIIDSSLRVGQEFDVTFELMNTSQQTIDGCFGDGFEVTFWNEHLAQGWAETVDHPTCKQRFTLAPGTSSSCSYNARVPSFPSGHANVVGWVQVVDPLTCDKYGCDRTRIKAATLGAVDVIDN